ncbi:MAG: sec-independent protein translocase protein TatA [Planctomycetota bacterium]|jgi:sec-independent protein translocase protein TatA
MPAALPMNILNVLGLVVSPLVTSSAALQGVLAWQDPLPEEGPMLALPGVAEWWPILIVVVLLFGARKLPELARAMGTSVTQFRKGLDNSEDEEPKSLDGKAEQSGE